MCLARAGCSGDLCTRRKTESHENVHHIHRPHDTPDRNTRRDASVVIISRPDSAYMTGATTAEDGRFSIPAREGEEYDLTASFIGYLDIRMVCTASDLGTLVMKEDTEMLDEVVIIASRTKYDATGYTVNLKSADIAKGKSTYDALAFLPNVTKEEGSFKINGVAVSEIYVDGVKLTSLDELSNIPAERIEQVKINYMAGVRQDASMTGGIIDITLSRPPEGGYYGSLSAGGEYQNYGYGANAGAMFYYRYKNLSIYDNLYFNANDSDETGWQSTSGTDGSLISHREEHSDITFWNLSNRLSLNQQIGKRNNIGVSYYIGYSDSHPMTGTVSDDNGQESTVKGNNTYLNQEVTLKYSSILNDRGTFMDITADWLGRRHSSDYTYSYTGQSDDRSVTATSSDLWKISADFSDPVSNKLGIEYGLSAQYITSTYAPEDFSVSSDRFYVSETPTQTAGITPLVYFSASGMLWNILRYSIGVNFQMNLIEYQALEGNREEFRNIQWGINPSLQIMAPLDKQGKHAVMLNYKRTLDGIPYDAISTTIKWIDPYNYSVGNPDLKAPTGDMVMLGFSLAQNMVNIAGVYMHSANSIYWSNFQDSENPDIYYETPVNLDQDENGLGAMLELNFNPIKPWRMKLSGRLTFTLENNTIDGIHYNGTNMRQYYTFLNQLNFKKGWGGMLNLIYEPTYKYLGHTYHAVYNLGGQIYKDFANGDWQLSLDFNLLGNRRRIDNIAGDRIITHAYTTPVQMVGLSLRWNFSGGKKVSVKTVQGSQNYEEIVNMR